MTLHQCPPYQTTASLIHCLAFRKPSTSLCVDYLPQLDAAAASVFSVYLKAKKSGMVWTGLAR